MGDEDEEEAAAFERHWRAEFPGEAAPALRLGSAAALQEELGRCRRRLQELQRALAEEKFKAGYLEAALGRPRVREGGGGGQFAPAPAPPVPPPRARRRSRRWDRAAASPPAARSRPQRPPGERESPGCSDGTTSGSSDREDASSAGIFHLVHFGQ
ncbi:UNVERIFIED_CONTAM: hypothetical protein K2H54_031537 [Gekko kuhli]